MHLLLFLHKNLLKPPQKNFFKRYKPTRIGRIREETIVIGSWKADARVVNHLADLRKLNYKLALGKAKRSIENIRSS